MDRYKFKLQKVLDYRTDFEDKKKEEFAEAQKIYIDEKDKLNKLVNTKEKEKQRSMDMKSIFEYQNYVKYIEFLNNKIEIQRHNLSVAEKFLSEKTEELVDAMKEKKVMEKLRDKTKNEFEYDASVKEQKQNDDFALFSFVRTERR